MRRSRVQVTFPAPRKIPVNCVSMWFAGILLFWNFTVKWRIIDVKSGDMGVKMGVNNITHNIYPKLYLY